MTLFNLCPYCALIEFSFFFLINNLFKKGKLKKKIRSDEMVVGAMLFSGSSTGLGIPKSPSFHSGLDLAAAKDFNFLNTPTYEDSHTEQHSPDKLNMPLSEQYQASSMNATNNINNNSNNNSNNLNMNNSNSNSKTYNNGIIMPVNSCYNNLSGNVSMPIKYSKADREQYFYNVKCTNVISLALIRGLINL